MRISQLLWNARYQKGLTQEQLAQALGVDKQSISRWERGERLPSPAAMRRLEHFFEVNFAKLADETKIDREAEKDAHWIDAFDTSRVALNRMIFEMSELGVSQTELDAAKALLVSKAAQDFYFSGRPMKSEEEITASIELLATGIKAVLDRRQKIQRETAG